jgi:hypothetical protein
MSLDHDFLLLDCIIDRDVDLSQFVNDSRALKLHDDVVRYMTDTLVWIPCFNPSRWEKCDGLNMWGVTLIREDGASIAQSIFRSWANLFASGPEVLNLQGNFDLEKERHDRFKLSRDDCVDTLNQIAGYLTQVQESKGNLTVLHFGV